MDQTESSGKRQGNSIGSSNEESKEILKPGTENIAVTVPDLTEPGNMEVHHHPHAEKKNFKEYLLEGLMIFVAVTLGFFAETIRESITEHERAKIFASSLSKDLEADAVQLRSYRAYFSYAANNIDTLMQLLSQSAITGIPSGKLYWYGLWGGSRRYFVANDATFQQMKSSGSLRYFEKTVASDFAKYDRFCRLMQQTDEMNKDIYTEVRKSRALIFDFRYNEIANNIVVANNVSFDQKRIDSFMLSNPPLLSYDKTLFNQYVELVRSRFIRIGNIANADSLIKQGSVLLGELKKEYNLEDE